MGSERPKMVTVVDRKTGARRLVKGVGFGFDETSHPRYPKGHPKGGKWIKGKATWEGRTNRRRETRGRRPNR